jgi:hypothetical protein
MILHCILGLTGITSQSIVHKNKTQKKQPGWGFEPDLELSFPFKVTRMQPEIPGVGPLFAYI